MKKILTAFLLKALKVESDHCSPWSGTDKKSVLYFQQTLFRLDIHVRLKE